MIIKPNAKEIARADDGLTIVVRPAAEGGYNIVSENFSISIISLQRATRKALETCE